MALILKEKKKRPNKLSKDKQLDLIFDLINAISLVNKPSKASLLLQDLLAPSEIKNISKRLRITKMLLDGKTHREITDETHTSFATIAKISVWLDEAGFGIKDIISKLPKRQEKVNIAGYRFRQYRLPEAIWEDYLNLKSFLQQKKVENLLKNTQTKKELFDKIQSAVDEIYKKKQKSRN
ncbi:hypothetical protein A2774_00950 [Candidatus Roizmanbacteria bacterium RIFCSPHIGHO2_01_FULL_39_12c]|uniref:TrpR like protein, YerC/YecD n=1 Tax=Candidatus Roizmanbacteria bacterium RIFCSPHIGHO2_01_FULL_39_12c TaxID=1802031 RepID=A0A1F7GF41_9BACT|nr:MAG: hypothetical protein A2774_00950 [Candidatus Roizmanbacteria bacterium RIFCSPHIGHO2_01_FULL_39_12c]OGK46556.1 MAG: hypothetical protein A2963_02365 [Candidatus Roizmanbacteria bacterium RIFCSPLOWO2_01_FULL_40_13]